MRFMVVLLLFFLVSCEKEGSHSTPTPRFDGKDPRASMERFKDGLSEEEFSRLSKTMKFIYMDRHTIDSDITTLVSLLDGKTVDEIREYAEYRAIAAQARALDSTMHLDMPGGDKVGDDISVSNVALQDGVDQLGNPFRKLTVRIRNSSRFVLASVRADVTVCLSEIGDNVRSKQVFFFTPQGVCPGEKATCTANIDWLSGPLTGLEVRVVPRQAFDYSDSPLYKEVECLQRGVR